MDKSAGQCLSEFISQEFSSKCFQILLAKWLGFSIILGSFVLKLPQILNMIKYKTAEGISSISAYSEVIQFLFALFYFKHLGSPFSSYGEIIVVLVQNLIITFLFWKYSPKRNKTNEYLITLSITVFSLFILHEEYVPSIFWFIFGSSGMLFVFLSRFSQLSLGFKEKSTGTNSIFTFILNFLGTIARVYTTLTENYDLLMLISYCWSVTLNFAMIVQIWVYRKNTQRVLNEKLKKH